MQEYYPYYCEGGFRERMISTVQVFGGKTATKGITADQGSKQQR